MNQSYIEETVEVSEEEVSRLELLLDKQDYLEYIDKDMEAFYQLKIDKINPMS